VRSSSAGVGAVRRACGGGRPAKLSATHILRTRSPVSRSPSTPAACSIAAMKIEMPPEATPASRKSPFTPLCRISAASGASIVARLKQSHVQAAPSSLSVLVTSLLVSFSISSCAGFHQACAAASAAVASRPQARSAPPRSETEARNSRAAAILVGVGWVMGGVEILVNKSGGQLTSQTRAGWPISSPRVLPGMSQASGKAWLVCGEVVSRRASPSAAADGVPAYAAGKPRGWCTAPGGTCSREAARGAKDGQRGAHLSRDRAGFNGVTHRDVRPPRSPAYLTSLPLHPLAFANL